MENDFAFICDPASPLKPALEITYAPYNVTFDSQEGNQVTAIVADYNTSIAEPSSPSKLNYTFGGWYKEATCTNQWNFTTDRIANNTTLYAKWNPVSYNVTFDSQGGTPVTVIAADYNTSIAEPSSPSKSNYTFGGWYNESTCTNQWNFTTDKIVSNTTLYAKWNPVSYNVTFDSQGGTPVTEIAADYNTSITEPSSPSKPNYTFGGWYNESTCTNQWNFTTDMIVGSTTLYAKWNPVSYNVTFDSQGGSAVSGISADYDNTISAVTPPTREGYTFDGWYKEVDCINVWNFTIDKVTSNKTLYAKWAKNKYTVNFDSQGGSQVSSQTVEDNSLITTPSVPTKTGCTFKGWYKEAEFINEWNFNEDKITCNTTLYSKWRINADINQDGEVDITDLAEIAKNYNDKSGDINWKADHDLNKDGIVDIYDLVSVSKSINQ